jgi:hypothetical protein
MKRTTIRLIFCTSCPVEIGIFPHITSRGDTIEGRMSTPMEVDPPTAVTTSAATKASASNKDKPRFEVKKVDDLN